MTTVRIYVTYKPSVFDPQGETITNSIHALGHQDVKSVTVGKVFDLPGDGDQHEAPGKQSAEELFVNYNMETYTYQVLEEK